MQGTQTLKDLKKSVSQDYSLQALTNAQQCRGHCSGGGGITKRRQHLLPSTLTTKQTSTDKQPRPNKRAPTNNLDQTNEHRQTTKQTSTNKQPTTKQTSIPSRKNTSLAILRVSTIQIAAEPAKARSSKHVPTHRCCNDHCWIDVWTMFESRMVPKYIKQKRPNKRAPTNKQAPQRPNKRAPTNKQAPKRPNKRAPTNNQDQTNEHRQTT
jgi:hypothetical protein